MKTTIEFYSSFLSWLINILRVTVIIIFCVIKNKVTTKSIMNSFKFNYYIMNIAKKIYEYLPTQLYLAKILSIHYNYEKESLVLSALKTLFSQQNYS